MPALLLLALACAGTPAPSEPAPEPAHTGPSTVQAAYPAPDGFTRLPADGFGTWLRERALEPADVPIHTHDGRTVGHDGRVVVLPLVKGDLQQCADSAIRLRAEWLKEQGQPVSFHATSGDPLPWARFEGGETPWADGNKVRWKQGSTGRWEDYLSKVFTWAGTDSLARLDTVAAEAPRPGDLLVQGGFPGHAVVLLDVATRGEEVLFLLGEGFMPAQDFHVEHGPVEGWWPWTGSVDLGHWAFDTSHLRRFREP